MLKVVKLKLMKKEVFKWNSFNFSGSFSSNCQENSVSPTLKMFVSMLLNGHNIRNQGSAECQSCLTIAQLTHFYIKHNAYNTEKQRHSKS